MLTTTLVLAAAIGGYVTSIYTWPLVRQAFVGIDAEIGELRDKLRELESRLRG